QLARARGIGSEVSRGGRKRADVTTHQEKLSAVDRHVGLLQLDAPGAYRLDLPALQGHAGFEPFLDEVVVEGFSVLYDAHGKGRAAGCPILSAVLPRPAPAAA